MHGSCNQLPLDSKSFYIVNVSAPACSLIYTRIEDAVIPSISSIWSWRLIVKNSKRWIGRCVYLTGHILDSSYSVNTCSFQRAFLLSFVCFYLFQRSLLSAWPLPYAMPCACLTLPDLTLPYPCSSHDLYSFFLEGINGPRHCTDCSTCGLPGHGYRSQWRSTEYRNHEVL